MTRARRTLLISLIASYTSWSLAANVEDSLRHDPFARPALAVSSPAGAAHNSPVVQDWKPQLRAVIKAGSSSMVNVEGTIVPLGGTIDGFRLTSVEERKAVFMKDGIRFELTMGANRADNRVDDRADDK